MAEGPVALAAWPAADREAGQPEAEGPVAAGPVAAMDPAVEEARERKTWGVADPVTEGAAGASALRPAFGHGVQNGQRSRLTAGGRKLFTGTMATFYARRCADAVRERVVGGQGFSRSSLLT